MQRKWVTRTTTRRNGIRIASPEYVQWNGMRARCRPEGWFAREFPTYVGCTYCDEWSDWDTFIGWARAQRGFQVLDEGGKVYQLDKDILQPSNRIYCPELCVFVPSRINKFFSASIKTVGKETTGICFSGKSYRILLNNGFGGRVAKGKIPTLEMAKEEYKLAKQNVARALAEHYRDTIDVRVYERLLAY